MNLLQDILTYIRRIIKTPSNAVISDNLLIDYVNRFYLIDFDARLQVFDLKTKYQFQTVPGVDQYNMPLYDVQVEPGSQNIGPFPVYQGFMEPARINGINVPMYTQRSLFFDMWPNYIQSLAPTAVGNGTPGPYTLQLPMGINASTVNQQQSGILRGHVDMAGIIASGVSPIQDPLRVTTLNLNIPVTSVYAGVYINSTNGNNYNVSISDSGQFLSSNQNYGLLMNPGNPPFGNQALPGGYSTTSNTVNYITGVINVTFPVVIPSGQNINTQCYWYQPGLPRAILFYNNCITLRNPPDISYLVELDAYLTPAAFLNTGAAIPFGYMAEYIARGAARKILADTGDTEQFMFYEQFFKEQELLVWKRSQRQWTATRTDTIYSNNGLGSNYSSNGLYGSGAT